MKARRLFVILAVAMVAGACTSGGGQQGGDGPDGGQTASPRPGAPVMLADVGPEDFNGCASERSPDGYVIAYVVSDGCASAGVPDGPAFTTSEGTFALADQLADVSGQGGWAALEAAFAEFESSEVSAQLSLAYAAYRFERTMQRVSAVGWNDAGTGWEFRMVTVGGEEDGVDVIPPYAVRFEIVFDARARATGVTYLGTCAVPGAEGRDAYPVDAPDCPA